MSGRGDLPEDVRRGFESADLYEALALRLRAAGYEAERPLLFLTRLREPLGWFAVRPRLVPKADGASVELRFFYSVTAIESGVDGYFRDRPDEAAQWESGAGTPVTLSLACKEVVADRRLCPRFVGPEPGGVSDAADQAFEATIEAAGRLDELVELPRALTALQTSPARYQRIAYTQLLLGQVDEMWRGLADHRQLMQARESPTLARRLAQLDDFEQWLRVRVSSGG